jgi:hypothetical protein
MATTDAKPGFRLPWSADRTAGAKTDGPPVDAPAVEPAHDPSDPSVPSLAEGTTPAQETESPAMIDAAPAATTNEAAVDADSVSTPTPTPADPASAAPTSSVAPSAGRKPNKFMADLTKAMQAAAESARADALERLTADAKAHIEAIHADSATEATDLRKQADDDVAAVRDWSKTEIARIREETDERIAHRKATLEREIEEHGFAVEARIERVQARVTAFEGQMADFFERLLAEDDPTRFAAMAESLPEPPPFDGPAPEPAIATVASEPAVAVAEVAVVATPEATPAAEQPAIEIEAAVETPPADPAWPAAETDMQIASEGTPPEGSADADLFSIGADEPAASTGDDPRLSALGLTPDFAAAEAEAASFSVEDDGSAVGADETVAEIGDDAIAARLAGLVPDADSGAATQASTRVIVVGLISVASIAGFKRHLSKATGVQSVGVSSGPDGEFIYLVVHDPAVAMRDIVTTLPGFAARVTGESEDGLTVTAQDPESGN